MQWRRLNQAATRIGAGQPDRTDAGGRERRDQSRVDRSRQNVDHDIQRGVVGNAQAVDLTLLDPGHLQRRIDLFAAAVDDDDRAAAARDVHGGCDDRSQPRRILEQFAAEFQNECAGHNRPAVSDSPSMTFMFCTAWPDAPFRRLSITEIRIARPDESTRQPISQKFVCATCLISGSWAPTSRTNGSPAYADSNTSPSASSVVPGGTRM